MSYFLSNINTGDTVEINDVKDAIRAFETSVTECELSNDDGEIIAEKMYTEGMDGDQLETMWISEDECDHTSNWMRTEMQDV